MLPLSHKSTVKLRSVQGLNKESMVGELVHQLEKLKARNIKVDRSCIFFRGGFFRLVINTNLLVPICCGIITVEEEEAILRVTYRLNFHELLVISLLLVIFLAVFAYGHSSSLSYAIGVVGFMFTFLVGGNILYAISGFRALIRRCWKTLLQKPDTLQAPERKTKMIAIPWISKLMANPFVMISAVLLSIGSGIMAIVRPESRIGFGVSFLLMFCLLFLYFLCRKPFSLPLGTYPCGKVIGILVFLFLLLAISLRVTSGGIPSSRIIDEKRVYEAISHGKVAPLSPSMFYTAVVPFQIALTSVVLHILMENYWELRTTNNSRTNLSGTRSKPNRKKGANAKYR